VDKRLENLVSISNILFNIFVNFTANCGSLSVITLSGNLYSFYALSWNNITNHFANVPSVVTTKYVILDNLLHTTNIVFFSAASGNFVIKFTIRCIYSFFSTSSTISFPASSSVLFIILWHKLYPSIYLFISFVTPGFIVTNSIVFYLLPCLTTSTS